MANLLKSRTYIVIRDLKELKSAQECDLCRFVIMESGNVIYIWSKQNRAWIKEKYVAFGNPPEKDEKTTGLEAYYSFYNYCGRDNVEAMKEVLSPIPLWESYEQMHYCDYEFAREKIYQNIYEFDANSAFTYGALQLPDGFEKLKEYMMLLYEKKQSSTNKITRSRYKNLQNYLIGYFARINKFVRVRSEIIHASNLNIKKRMAEIKSKGGNVYLSNTDSIVTNDIGADVMQKYLGSEVGRFKLNTQTSRLFYLSPNAYQLGDKVVYSGVSYFARKHTDFFADKYASQRGSLINSFDFILETSDPAYKKLCRIREGTVIVTVTNSIGEEISEIIYELKKGELI